MRERIRERENMEREWESNDQRRLLGQSNEGKKQPREKQGTLRT